MDKKIALKRNIAIIMGVSIAFLVLLIFILSVSQDTVGPGIRIDQAKMQYSYGCDDDKLLFGVTALDAVDGDVTDTVTLEKRVSLSAGRMEIVKYVACDKSGNVTFMEVLLVSEESGAYKILPSDYYVVDYDSLKVTIKDTNITGVVENAIIYIDEEIDNSTENDAANEDMTDVDEEQTTRDEATKEEQSTKKEESVTTKKEETTTKAEQETTKSEPVKQKPVITLNVAEITINKGETINWVKYIKNITDDKDNRDSLFRKVYLTKDIDVNVAGDYTQGLYCIDSDGLRSDTVTILVHIQ